MTLGYQNHYPCCKGIFAKLHSIVVKHTLAKVKAPLQNATAINAICKALRKRVSDTNLPLAQEIDMQTNYNRKQLGWNKAYWLYAAVASET